MKSTWHPFEGKGTKTGSYKITVMKTKQGRGGFGFLSGFFYKEKIASFEYVLLFYDPTNTRIGFSFTNEDKTVGAFKLTKGPGSASVFPHSFWPRFEIDIEKWAGQHIPKTDNDKKFGKIYYIEHDRNRKHNH